LFVKSSEPRAQMQWLDLGWIFEAARGEVLREVGEISPISSQRVLRCAARVREAMEVVVDFGGEAQVDERAALAARLRSLLRAVRADATLAAGAG
jgi:hypothetical protein